MAQSSGSERSGSKYQNGSEDRQSNGERNVDRTASRQAAVERLKVSRGISPERPLSSAQSYTGTKILKKPPVKRSTAPKSIFPTPFRSPGAGVNTVRDAGLKAFRNGPIALNTKKRDLRSFEEVSAELMEKDARRDERARKMKEIEEERERQRQQRERALQGAKYSKALMGDDANETERVFKEVTGDSKGSRRGKSTSRSRSRSRSPRRRDRSQSPVQRRRSRSPVRRKRSVSPAGGKKRGYSPEGKKRSQSPRRRRSISPPVKRRMSRDFSDKDRERYRDRDQDRDRDRMNKNKSSNGAARRRVSRTPSPRPAAKKRMGSPRGNGRGRGPFEEDFSVSNVIGALFGTRYRARAEDEDLSDDMEARPDEVFREEARSARIARKEDEEEEERERAHLARKRKKLGRDRDRS
ncbi:hypothetical protein BGZ58_000684 [Dissophora ornata]|nr:hypothetical protein BGZ58_000684 [Dissophora ornata]